MAIGKVYNDPVSEGGANRHWQIESDNDGKMIELSPALVAAIVCAILYWGSVTYLLAKNPRRTDAWLVAAIAAIAWPCLLFGSIAQLLFLVPLYTVVYMHGSTLPKSLPLRTAVIAVALTFLALGIMVALEWLLLEAFQFA